MRMLHQIKNKAVRITLVAPSLNFAAIAALLLLWATNFKLQAQVTWSLRKCIDIAVENNLSLKSQQLRLEQAKIQLSDQKSLMTPQLSGFANGGINFGRNIDPSSNDYITQNIISGNYGLNASITLFQGGYIRNSIRQAKQLYDAENLDYQQAELDLSLQVAAYYLNVLLTDESIDIASENLLASNRQLEQVNSLIKAGSKPELDGLELQTQVARSEQQLVTAENNFDLAWLKLRQALRVPESTLFELEKLSDAQLNTIVIETYEPGFLYDISVENQPGLKAAKLQLEAANIGEKISRSLYFPSVGIGANLGSNYSNAAKEISGYTIKKTIVPGIYIDGRQVIFEQESPVVDGLRSIPFRRQFDLFLGYGLGLNIQIPILSQNRTRNSVARAKINSRQQQINLESKKLALSQDIHTASSNLKAAEKEYQAADKTYQASKITAEKLEKKFSIGAATTYELDAIRTNLLNSRVSLLISKYDLLFKQKVLDYYAGKKIN